MQDVRCAACDAAFPVPPEEAASGTPPARRPSHRPAVVVQCPHCRWWTRVILDAKAAPAGAPGDWVVHRSGGPAMIVASTTAAGDRVFCTWFDTNGNQQFRSFPPDTLRKSEPAGRAGR